MRDVLRINYHTYHPVNKEDKEEYQVLWFTALGGTYEEREVKTNSLLLFFFISKGIRIILPPVISRGWVCVCYLRHCVILANGGFKDPGHLADD